MLRNQGQSPPLDLKKQQISFNMDANFQALAAARSTRRDRFIQAKKKESRNEIIN